MPSGDVMKTPLLKDLSALRRCNPPALRLAADAVGVARHWQEKTTRFSM